MTKVKEMTVADLEQFIEHKLFEIIGDPDSGLKLRKDFREKIEKRRGKTSKRISHAEVLKKFA